jgi:hypothetical protein
MKAPPAVKNLTIGYKNSICEPLERLPICQTTERFTLNLALP